MILRRLQSAKDQPVRTDGRTDRRPRGVLRQVCRWTVAEGRPGDARLQRLSGGGHGQFYARMWCRGVARLTGERRNVGPFRDKRIISL